MVQWLGPQSVAYVPVVPINDNRFGAPSDFKELVIQRLLFNPDANSVDRSLRAYLFSVSYGRAMLQPTVFDTVTVPDPEPIGLGQASGEAISIALANSPAFSNACAVFSYNPGYWWPDYAFWGNSNPIPGTNVYNFCYDFIESEVGAWAMEHTHMLTYFGDLYKTTDADPGAFDNMSCACGVHPSTFTKLKLGWLDPSEIVDVSTGSQVTQTLHALALPRPSPPGRCTALRVPTGDPQHYLLVEARLRTDPFDAGIPSEGVVVYEVNEAIWAPLHLRTPTALGVSESFNDPAFQGFWVTVDSAVTGGFTVHILFSEDPRCATDRAEISAIRNEIGVLVAELRDDLTLQERTAILAKIRALQAELTNLQADLASLGCAL